MATFGNTNFDVSIVASYSANSKVAASFVADRAGTLKFITVNNVGSTHLPAQIGFYADASGHPGALLAISAETIPSFDGDIYSVSINAPIQAGHRYWAAVLVAGNSSAFAGLFCEHAAGLTVNNGNAYGSGFSDPFGATSTTIAHNFIVNFIYTPTLTAGTYLGEITGGPASTSAFTGPFVTDQLWALQVITDEDGTFAAINYYVGNDYDFGGSDFAIFCLFGNTTDGGGNNIPGDLIATTAAVTTMALNGNSIAFNPPIDVVAGIYYIGVLSKFSLQAFTSTSNNGVVFTNTASPYASGVPSTFPAPAGGASSVPTFWATFSGASPPPPPVSSTCTSYSGTSSAVRLIPFQFSTQQAYALEFGDQYMRVIMNGGLVLEPAFDIQDISQSSPGLLTAAGNDWVAGDWIFISGVTGMTDVNDLFFYVGSSGGTVQLFDLDGTAFDTSSFPAYVSGGTAARVFVLTTPYAAEDLRLLKFTQSADVMTLTHPNYQPMDLTRTQHYAWTLTAIDFSSVLSAPTGIVQSNTVASDLTDQKPMLYQYAITAVSDLTGTESLPGFSVPGANYPLDQVHGTSNNLTWTGVTGATRYNIYKATPVYLPQRPAAYFGYIGSSKSTTFSDLNFASDFGSTPPVHADPFTMGQIIDIETLTQGSGYAIDATVTAVDPSGTAPSPGDGFVGLVSFAQGLSASPADLTSPIASIVIINPGKNYSTGTTLQITASTGAGATFNVTTTPVVDASDTTNPDWPNPNYPGVSTYFQQRKIFAASKSHPDTIWGTQTGNFKDMDVSFPVRDSDALTLALASQEVNAIEFLVTMPSGMVTLTSDGAWQVSGGAPGTALTQTSAQATPQAFNGASNSVPPLRINFDILYVPYQGSNARDLSYNFFTNIYTGTDITVLSSHLFFGRQLIEWTYAEDPNYLIWAVRNDGTLLSCTWMKEQEIVGWARHDTQGCFQSICSIPEVDDDGSFTQAVYVVVERRIPGVNFNNPTLYVERFASRKYLTAGEVDPTKPWFVDCGARYSGPPATIITGLGYLEGLEVVGLADGNVLAPMLVIGGKVTLPYAASLVTLGLPYVGQLKTLRLDTGDPTIQSKRKKINRAVLRVVETRGLVWGHDETDLTPFKMRTPEIAYGDPIPLETGDQLLNLAPLWDAEGQVVIEQQDPLPATVTGIMLWTTIGDTPG